MCTGIAETVQISGIGKGPRGWFKLEQVSVSYDHPSNARPEHTLNIDFLSRTEGPSARVAVELTAESARKLIQTILTTLSRARVEVGGAVGAGRSSSSDSNSDSSRSIGGDEDPRKPVLLQDHISCFKHKDDAQDIPAREARLLMVHASMKVSSTSKTEDTTQSSPVSSRSGPVTN